VSLDNGKIGEIFGALKFLCFHLRICSLGKFVIFFFISIYMHSVDIWLYDKTSKTGIGLELVSMHNIFNVG